ncbi:hypothetical protein ACE193_00795 [Bernardetia sp. OM2101]|uniref:hypothetical protein n=1 Tax=Bernardetia sp. OM2101 TaxID=3344876 RepID=UPI0035D06C4F
MKDTILFFKISFFGIVTLACFIISFISLYLFLSQTSNFDLEKYMHFSSSDRGRIKMLVGMNVVLILVPLLISLFSFKKGRKIYNSLSQ